MVHRATKHDSAPSQSLGDRAAASRASAAHHISAATKPTQFANSPAYAEAFDFSAFSIAEMKLLYELTRDAAHLWLHISNLSQCSEPSEFKGISQSTTVGQFVDHEYGRLCFLRDRCVREIQQRKPVDDEERDRILSVRILHGIECSGRIDFRDDPGLLIEALKAWG